MNFWARLIVNAVAIAIVTSGFLPGIRIEGEENLLTLLLIALIFGIVNAMVKPIVQFFTCSLVILTFGLFLLIINGAMLYLTSWLSTQLMGLTGGHLVIDGFGWALVGAIIISIIGMVLERLLGGDEKSIVQFK